MSALVSIITVNYKQPTVTCELLQSISTLGYPNLEVIVVDNGQVGDDSQLYKSVLPKVKVYNTEENLGFAGGNNLGIQKANGEYIFLLNNDTELENGVIESLIEQLERPEVAAVSPILKFFSHPDRIQFAGFTEINSITGRNELLTSVKQQEPYATPYFHGATVMLKKSIIDECGLMPEEFFLYYEELAWSKKIRSKGYHLMIDPTVSVFHKESVTTGKNSPLKLYYQTRNRVHFMRNNGLLNWLMFMSFFLTISIPKGLLKHALLRERNHLRAFLKAIKDALFFKKYGFQPI